MERFVAVALLLLSPLVAPAGAHAAGDFDDVIRAELRTGWRQADGTHMAGLHLRLAPGWKTYWRAPGDAGIPPLFDWNGSRNLADVQVAWPTPKVFDQGGMRSIGYANDVVFPLIVRPGTAGQPVALRGEIQIGLCKDVCLPHTLKVSVELPAAAARPDPKIAAALASAPFSARDASVGRVSCKVMLGADGEARLRAVIEVGSTGAPEETVFEPRDPEIWAAPPNTRRDGDRLIAETRLRHVTGGAFAIDRSRLRITVLGTRHAVDIRGCDG